MPICATEGCGVPGRPFPACDICKSRRYCGSHCLVCVTVELLNNFMEAQEQHSHEDPAINVANVRIGMEICPVCVSKLLWTQSSE